MTLTEAKKLWKLSKDSKLDGYKITGYLGSDPIPVVPDEVDGVPVVALGNNALRDNEIITGIVLPDSIISLGNAAFRHCTRLEEIDLPDGILELPKQLFAGCQRLRRVKLPARLIAMESSVFSTITDDEHMIGCDALEELTISADNSKFTAIDGILYNKEGTKILVLPNKTSITLPDTLTEIPSYAFSGMKCLKSIVLPDKLKKIGKGAFAQCQELENVTIPASVKTIGDMAFWLCPKLDLTFLGAKTKLDKQAIWECPNVVIFAPAGSPAQKYAEERDLTFIETE